MSPTAIEDIYPLSPMQQGMLFHALYSPGSGVYVEQMACSLSGPLQAPLFRDAWNQTVAQHPILRTVFVWEGLAEPLQVVLRQATLPWRELEWRGLSSGERDARLDDLLRRDSVQGFDLARAPLMRVALVRTGEARHYMIWTHHHLLLDGWSGGLLLREVFARYEALVSGDAAGLEPPRPFRDYIAWLQEQDLAVAERFWREELRGFSAPTSLATDTAPRDGDGGEEEEKERAVVSQELSRALRDMARRNALTLNTLVQAAWALLLSRHSGEDDVIFGATVSGRPAELPGADSMIGLFINTLPVRVRTAADEEVLPWLRKLQDHQIELSQYEHTPLVRIQEWSEVPRGSALFQSILVFENLDGSGSRLAGAGGSTVPGKPGDRSGLDMRRLRTEERAGFPLTLAAFPGECLEFQASYVRRRFEDGAVRRLLGHLEALLGDMARSRGGRRTRDLSLLSEAERKHLLGMIRGPAEMMDGRPVSRILEARALEKPGAVAVTCGQESLTRIELEVQANRLASVLLLLGVGPERRVAILLERSLDLAVAILAVIKSGAAFVPLEPSHPPERLAWIVQDADPLLVLTRGDLAPLLPPGRARIVRLDELDEETAAIAAGSPKPLAEGPAPDSLAYLIYTSGSTGRPKAVLVEHRQLSQVLGASQLHFRFSPQDVMPWLASASFDIALFELFNPLLGGGACRLVTREELLNLPRFVEELRGMTALHAVPSLMQRIVDGIRRLEGGKEGYERIRLLFVGGDVVPPELLEDLKEVFPKAEIFVLYGPTEGTIIATCARVPRDQRASRPLLGRPLANVQLRLVDWSGELVPPGVSGELWLGGQGVTRGYLGRSDLTSERYVAADGGGRWYRTGDLARMHPDGDLEYVGRIDRQVKIRGFRVELDEIEAALARCPGVRQAATAVQTDALGDRQIVAYVVFSEAEAASLTELRLSLRRLLPEHMVPAVFTTLSELPLNTNGKVDHRRLPAVGRERRGGPYVAPRHPLEQRLARIWEDLLGAESIGIEDDFFTLGGHSLLAIRVVSRIREELGKEIPLRDLFEHPTIAGLAAKLESGTAGRPIEPGEPVLQPVEAGEAFPLSFAQQRIWFLEQLGLRAGTYNMPSAMRLEGSPDVAALERALGEIVRRHEVLRTTFSSDNGTPRQVVAPHRPFVLPVVDLTSLGPREREAESDRRVREEAQRPFDLTRGLLLRARLLVLAPDAHVLFLGFHHVASDGWSNGVFWRELAEIYDALVHGRPVPLPDLAFQYKDFAAWQRQSLSGARLAEQLEYWRERLFGLPALQLPSDHPRPAEASFNGGQYGFSLGSALADSLLDLGRSEGATLFMVCLSAYGLLLQRYSGQEDLAVGTPIANRTRAEIEALIGFFVNTLVLRLDLAGAPTGREMIRRVKDVTLGAYAHQDLPFEQVVEEMHPDRDLGRQPLIQVLFVLQNLPGGAPRMHGLEVKPLPIGTATAKFDLTLFLTESASDVSATLEYALDLFEAPTVRRMAGHFLHLAAAMAASPDLPITELPILVAEERQQILAAWNSTRREIPRAQGAHRLFEDAARCHPSAVAAVCGDETLSYSALDRRSNQLARHLRGLGVGPEVRVAVLLRRSLDLPVALLGTLKAGGAYVPLDYGQPAERISFILNDAEVSVVLTHEEFLERLLLPPSSAAVLRLDSQWDEIARHEELILPEDPDPENLAYMIYTSGSTGWPKGVGVPHRGLVNYLSWALSAYPVKEGKGAPVHSPVSFDLTVTSLFLPLLAGSTIHLLPDDGVEALGSALRGEAGFGLVKLTPSHLELLARQVSPREAPGCARAFVIGGESLAAETLAFWQDFAPKTALINEYGPTEAVVGCCVYPVPRRGCVGATVPIGRPIANARMYLLDRYGQPVPVGVVGEIHIGGDGVTRGYLRRPDLTAERFLPDPFAGVPGARSYRSGDLGRYLPEGDLVCLGRIDHQLKVRGYRIEPGEIEAALLELPAVRETVVVARKEAQGGHRLCAYLSFVEDAEPPSVTELRHALGRRLPEFMIPALFVSLPRLPLTANGKVDRSALPEPDVSRLWAETDLVPPRNPTEEILAAIWREVLGLDRVGVEDNFFALGGDSILSLQIVARAGRAGLSFAPRHIFQHQTIAALTEVVMQSAETAKEQEAVSGPVALTPIQRWFFDQDLPNPQHYNQALLLAIHRPLSPAVLDQVWLRLVEHHDALRLRFRRDPAGWEQHNAPAEALSAVRIDMAGLRGDIRSQALAEAADCTQRSLGLEDGPLLRVVHFEVGAGRPGLLLIVIHHLAVDGVSWRILLEDLRSTWEQALRKEEILLPPKTTSFQMWAQRLADHAGSLEARRDAAYWLALPWDRVSPLPVDHCAGANTLATARHVKRALSVEETRTLLQEVPQTFRTHIGEVLLTALVEALAPWTGTRVLLVDLEGHGREELFDGIDVSRTVGWFTSIYPVILILPEGRLRDVLMTAKEQLRSVPNRGVGYGILRFLGGDPQLQEYLAGQPQPEISFNYLGQFDASLPEGGPFGPAAGASGASQDPAGCRSHVLDFAAVVTQRRLHVDLTYSASLHRAGTIEALADRFLEALRRILRECGSVASEASLTPADFPLARLDAAALTRVLALLEESAPQSHFQFDPMDARDSVAATA